MFTFNVIDQVTLRHKRKINLGLDLEFYTFWYGNQQMFQILNTQKFLSPKISDFF